MHIVAVLALDGVVAFDLSTPLEVFTRSGGGSAYEVRVCAPAPEIDAGAFVLRAPWGLDALDTADTIILPGIVDVSADVPSGRGARPLPAPDPPRSRLRGGGRRGPALGHAAGT
jgi:hypothetical protein